MSSIFAKVAHFNHHVLEITPRPVGLQSHEEARLSERQLIEEAEEFLDAVVEDKDVVKAVDACIDSIYFALGILYKMGVTEEKFDSIFEVVHNANMKKVMGKKANRQGFDAADATKPEDWVAPEVYIERILNDD